MVSTLWLLSHFLLTLFLYSGMGSSMGHRGNYQLWCPEASLSPPWCSFCHFLLFFLASLMYLMFLENVNTDVLRAWLVRSAVSCAGPLSDTG